jgi:lysozyme
MRISDAGIRFLKEREKFMPQMYNDQAGHCTIGYGHLVHFGPIDGRESEKMFAKGMTEHEAHCLLLDDIKTKAENYVNSGLEISLPQNQFDALICLAFNIGGAAFMGSTLLKHLNRGEMEAAALEFRRWNRAGGAVSAGLVKRRQLEEEMFRGLRGVSA